MLARFGEALFWTKAIAGVWMVAGTATHGADMYARVHDQMFGAPVRTAVATAGPVADLRCPPPLIPRPADNDTLRVADFELGPDGQVDPLQYTNPRTGQPYAAVTLTGGGSSEQHFRPGTYYLLPEQVVFLPAVLEAKTDSVPYVSDALYVSLSQLACFVALANGEVRVNKALLSFPRQRYWELDRDLLADGLGTNSVHLQIVDIRSEKRTPWDQDQVDAAVAKARLNVPQPDRFRAYVRLRT